MPKSIVLEVSRIKTDYLLHQEVERVLAALTPSNRLVMRVCLHTGLRLGDVLALRPEQIAPHMWVTECKTGKRKIVGLTSELRADLLHHAGQYWVFPARCDPKKHRSRQAVWRDVKRAAKLFRFPQNVAPHSFRKVYAVDLLRKYGDIDRVRRALNHSSDAVTMIYAMADKLLAQQYRKPRRRA